MSIRVEGTIYDQWVANVITGEYYSITYSTNPKVTNWIRKVPFDHDYICIWKDQRNNRWCIGNCGFDDDYLSQCGVGENPSTCECWIYNPSITNCPQDAMISNWMIENNDEKIGADLKIRPPIGKSK